MSYPLLPSSMAGAKEVGAEKFAWQAQYIIFYE